MEQSCRTLAWVLVEVADRRRPKTSTQLYLGLPEFRAYVSAVRFMGRWSDGDVCRASQQIDAGEFRKLSDASLPIEAQRVANNVPDAFSRF